MALHDQLRTHTYDAQRLTRMLDTLWTRITGESRPDDDGLAVAERSDPGLVDLAMTASMATRRGLEIAQALLDFVGPEPQMEQMASPSTGGTSRSSFDVRGVS